MSLSVNLSKIVFKYIRFILKFFLTHSIRWILHLEAKLSSNNNEVYSFLSRIFVTVTFYTTLSDYPKKLVLQKARLETSEDLAKELVILSVNVSF